MIISSKVITFTSLALLLLAACAPAPAGQNLVGTSWRLVSLDGITQLGEAIGGQAVTLSFDASTQAGGSGGCNGFGAEYSANPDAGAIAFSNIISTLMACIGEGIGEVEAYYFEALSLADTYRVDGSSLTITGGGHTLIFERTSESS